jgi:hypothetical protein
MATTWKTKSIVCQGGMRLDLEPVMLDSVAPGALIDSQNVESGTAGGYSRLEGYALYSPTALPGSGSVLGAFVFNDGVVGCRGSNICFGTGSNWTVLASNHSNVTKYRGTKYQWSEKRLILVDGSGAPFMWNGSSASNFVNAPSGATCVKQFKNYICYGKGGILTISAPNVEDVVSSVSGGATLNIGDTIQNFAVWRDSLYILCTSSIYRLDGDSASNWTINPVTLDIGCPYPDTVQEMVGDVYFLSSDGIRTISGTSEVQGVDLALISQPVRPTLDTLVDTYTTATITALQVFEKSQYRLFFSASNVTATNSPGINVCFTKHEGNLAVEFFNLLGIQVSAGDTGRIASNNSELVVHGCQNGYIFKQEYGDNFIGGSIPAYVTFPYYVFDDPAIRKTLYTLRAYIKVVDNALAYLTLQVNLDDNDAGILQPPAIDLTTAIPPGAFIYGYSVYGAAIYGQGASVNYRTNPVGAGFNIGFKISSNDTNPVWNIRTMILEYEMEERE